ncbi:hypothetical protein SAMN05444003_0290 [Cognatiyoonia sediminum]|uniref:Uncharacterized protein n=1 Tax=Cognatiyoonia sediminum TaxID=1508389 RepID=A0A1M5LIE1_9RHOB|nr:hypothetical protein [Cognatiyoonia sediminum]SHG64449.1 hypothetical protein SAMN05444003_0290 [Cognatiyoonia sediminum]
MANDEPKTICRTPAEGKPGTTRIPTWKFDLLRGHILNVVREAGSDGLPFRDLSSLVAKRLTEEETTRLGSIGWHTTTVKLEMEVARDIKRLEGVSPQRLVLA